MTTRKTKRRAREPGHEEVWRYGGASVEKPIFNYSIEDIDANNPSRLKGSQAFIVY